jgi:hypothetical protein
MIALWWLLADPGQGGRPGKADRRDAVMLAKLHRAGELTAIWIPDAAHEAMRDLVRARATAGWVLSKARQHLQSFLLRHDQIYRGARAWTLAYRRWLTTVRFAHPAQQIVLQNYVHAVQDAEARLDRLTRDIEELLPSWSMAALEWDYRRRWWSRPNVRYCGVSVVIDQSWQMVWRPRAAPPSWRGSDWRHPRSL